MNSATSNHLSVSFSTKNILIGGAVILLGISIINTWSNIIVVKDEQFNDEFFAKNISTNAVVAQGVTSPNYTKNVNELPGNVAAEVSYLEKQALDTPVVMPTNNSVMKKESETLTLVEAYSPNINQGINKADISGEISTENGNIKSLSFSIPGVDAVELADLKIEGNVFRFQKDGQDIQGMVYPISNTAYLVNFITGPMQGMRLRFNSEEAEEQQQQYAEKMMEEQQRQQEEALAIASMNGHVNDSVDASKSIASEGSVVEMATPAVAQDYHSISDTSNNSSVDNQEVPANDAEISY
ncbi:MAG: hypothetical protein QE271_06920 [Bacteriovoracaceae bacterium]|nr:hypothetical protein [Bacteriovoracaceae bacterium]